MTFVLIVDNARLILLSAWRLKMYIWFKVPKNTGSPRVRDHGLPFPSQSHFAVIVTLVTRTSHSTPRAPSKRCVVKGCLIHGFELCSIIFQCLLKRSGKCELFVMIICIQNIYGKNFPIVLKCLFFEGIFSVKFHRFVLSFDDANAKTVCSWRRPS